MENQSLRQVEVLCNTPQSLIRGTSGPHPQQRGRKQCRHPVQPPHMSRGLAKGNDIPLETRSQTLMQ